MKSKLRIVQYSLTGCEGCAISLINVLLSKSITEYVDIVSSRILGKVDLQEADMAIIDGSVITEEDAKIIRDLRRYCRYIVALGTCACLGGINALREFVEFEDAVRVVYGGVIPGVPHTTRVEPVTSIIDVDFIIPGCPPLPSDIENFIISVILGKKFRLHEEPVCYECKVQGFECVITKGLVCLGPITRGGCKALCIAYGVPCWGCRGLAEEPRFDVLLDAVRNKGLDVNAICEKLMIFLNKMRKSMDLRCQD